MKRRIKNKITKKKNMVRQQTILKQIGEKFTVQKANFGGGYFIFYMGLNSVCHFQLKETPDWKYGIWLYKDGFEIFGEHIDLIDKFKPSRTYVSCGSDLEQFINKVEQISLHPKLYLVDAFTGQALYPYKKHEDEEDVGYTGYQVVREYNEETKMWDIYSRDESITQEDFVNKEYQEHMDDKAKQEKENREDRKYAFAFFKELPNLFEEITAVGVIDGNKKGLICSPRYNLRVALDPSISRERMDELFKEIDDVVWSKDRPAEKYFREHQFSFFGVYTDMKDIKVCDYIYFKEGIKR